jgi:hypothetical protein
VQVQVQMSGQCSRWALALAQRELQVPLQRHQPPQLLPQQMAVVLVVGLIQSF